MFYNNYRFTRCLVFHNRDLFIACNFHETSVHFSKIYMNNILLNFHVGI